MSDQETREVLLAIGRLEGKVDTFQNELRHVVATSEDHDERIRVMESRWAWTLGACAAISILTPYIINLLHK